MNMSRPGTRDAYIGNLHSHQFFFLKATLSHPRLAGGLSLKHTCSIQQGIFLVLVHPRCHSQGQVQRRHLQVDALKESRHMTLVSWRLCLGVTIIQYVLDTIEQLHRKINWNQLASPYDCMRLAGNMTSPRYHNLLAIFTVLDEARLELLTL
jgi:hypothetical protein